MEDLLDERITEIERILGIDEHSTVRATDFDVASLLEKMRALGLERVMKIPLYKFKKLKSVSTMPETRSLSERLLTIEFCESLIRQRAELLKEFEERLQVVLKTDKVSIAAEQEEQLDILQSDILKSLDDWKQYSYDLENFKIEYFSIIAALQQRLEELDRMASFPKKFEST